MKEFSVDKRVKETISCRDADDIPKVAGAGKIFTENGITYQLMHNGVKIIQGCYHGDWMTEIIEKLNGHHEPQQEKAFHETLKVIPDNAVMIELGSFWSYYSLWFNKKIRNASNYMVEPTVEKLRVGQKNFEINGAKGTFINAFVGDQFRESATFNDWDGKKYTLPQVSIDYLVKKYSIPFVDLIHSDIQGAETEMLKGCAASVKDKKIGYCIISTHGDSRHQKCLQQFHEYGFDIITHHNTSEGYSAEGLIVAVAKHLNSPLQGINVSKKKVNIFNPLIKRIQRLIKKTRQRSGTT